MATMLGLQGLPLTLPPVFSCRSGLPVLLNTVTKQGPPAPKPFKLTITKKESDLSEINIMQFEELTMDQVCACHAWIIMAMLSGGSHAQRSPL
jgi:hypothetical protein